MWINDAAMKPNDVKEFNSKDWYYCATCGHWLTTYITNSFIHQGKTIAKHDGQPQSKHPPDRDSPSDKSSNDKSNK